jgi:protein-S-isoprenylcysteine O-methyltransferase Ste14
MYRARTNILPHRAADKLLTSGVFALTRNPIYLGNTLLLTGIALFTAAVWLIPATMIAAFAVDRLAIRREELHLAVRFGDAFQAYVQTTPRWLGVPWKNAAAK